MTMRKRAGSAIITLAAAAAVVGMAAAPAMAATTLHVKITHGGTYIAKAASTVLTDHTAAGNVSVTCVTKTASGKKVPASTGTGKVSTATHTGTSPVTVGSVKTLNFKHCTGPLGSVNTTVQALPYKLKIDSKTVSGKTDGIITGVKVKVVTGSCSFMVTGSAPGYYKNSDHTLHVTPKLPIKPLNKAQLTVSNVNSGCLGVINNGDHPTYTGTYSVSRHFVVSSK